MQITLFVGAMNGEISVRFEHENIDDHHRVVDFIHSSYTRIIAPSVDQFRVTSHRTEILC